MAASLTPAGGKPAAAVLVTIALLAGCGGKALRWEPRVHVVRAGESLHQIAFRHRIDAEALAGWNRIDNPDLIFAGQRLRLDPPPDYQPRKSMQVPAPQSGAAVPTAGPGPEIRPGDWQWPATGPVIAGYGDPTSLGRGVDVSGNQGDIIVAAAPGRVVYSGSGLLGYGNLIILKHNVTFLSAYGHNSELLVREGDKVKAGQPIAKMGLGPGDQAVLHFEIRQHGKPVDPMKFLPAR